MAISEERLQILLPRRMKQALLRAARKGGLSAGEYIRRLIDRGIGESERNSRETPFPFGENPIHTGRTRGSIDHDRNR